jgi:hypothetical protein
MVYVFAIFVAAISYSFYVDDRQDAEQDRETKERFESDRRHDERVAQETAERIYTVCITGNYRSAQIVAFIQQDLTEVGIPMPPEVRERAARRFPQVECPPKPKSLTP